MKRLQVYSFSNLNSGLQWTLNNILLSAFEPKRKRHVSIIKINKVKEDNSKLTRNLGAFNKTFYFPFSPYFDTLYKQQRKDNPSFEGGNRLDY